MIYNYKITKSAYDDIDNVLVTVLRVLHKTLDIANILKDFDIDLL